MEVTAAYSAHELIKSAAAQLCPFKVTSFFLSQTESGPDLYLWTSGSLLPNFLNDMSLVLHIYVLLEVFYDGDAIFSIYSQCLKDDNLAFLGNWTFCTINKVIVRLTHFVSFISC